MAGLFGLGKNPKQQQIDALTSQVKGLTESNARLAVERDTALRDKEALGNSLRETMASFEQVRSNAEALGKSLAAETLSREQAQLLAGTRALENARMVGELETIRQMLEQSRKQAAETAERLTEARTARNIIEEENARLLGDQAAKNAVLSDRILAITKTQYRIEELLQGPDWAFLRQAENRLSEATLLATFIQQRQPELYQAFVDEVLSGILSSPDPAVVMRERLENLPLPDPNNVTGFRMRREWWNALRDGETARESGVTRSEVPAVYRHQPTQAWWEMGWDASDYDLRPEEEAGRVPDAQ